MQQSDVIKAMPKAQAVKWLTLYGLIGVLLVRYWFARSMPHGFLISSAQASGLRPRFPHLHLD